MKVKQLVASYGVRIGNIKLHKVSDLTKLKKTVFDVCIIATTSNDRVELISKICEYSNVKNWIIEKIISQSGAELEKIHRLTSSSERVFVDYNRRASKWYMKIKEYFKKHNISKIICHNINFELACNAIHFIDLASWISDKKLLSLNTNQIIKWNNSKRDGFLECIGVIEAHFDNNMLFRIESNKPGQVMDDFSISVTTQKGEYFIHEDKGYFKLGSNTIIKGRMEYLSEIMPVIIHQILNKKDTPLPELSDVFYDHNIYIESLRAHYNSNCNLNKSHLAIT